MMLPLFLALALSSNCQPIATGSLLVGTAKSADPDFARSVVLLIHYDSASALGLMLNKPTSVPVTDVLAEATGQSATVYAGGPIMIGVRGLLRSKSPPYFSVISNKSQLLRLISQSAPPSSFRIYAGYVGWTAAQLQSEIARGLWKVLPANAGTVFDPHPNTLWQNLKLRNYQH